MVIFLWWAAATVVCCTTLISVKRRKKEPKIPNPWNTRAESSLNVHIIKIPLQSVNNVLNLVGFQIGSDFQKPQKVHFFLTFEKSTLYKKDPILRWFFNLMRIKHMCMFTIPSINNAWPPSFIWFTWSYIKALLAPNYFYVKVPPAASIAFSPELMFYGWAQIWLRTH